MILIIDPTVSKTYRFFLLTRDYKKIAFKKVQSNKLLEELDRFLKKNQKKPEEIKVLGVFEGAGSFTALRNVAAVANVWQNIYDLKVFGIDAKKAQKRSIKEVAKGLFTQKPKARIYIPKYSGPPNITIPKPK